MERDEKFQHSQPKRHPDADTHVDGHSQVPRQPLAGRPARNVDPDTDSNTDSDGDTPPGRQLER